MSQGTVDRSFALLSAAATAPSLLSAVISLIDDVDGDKVLRQTTCATHSWTDMEEQDGLCDGRPGSSEVGAKGL